MAAAFLRTSPGSPPYVIAHRCGAADAPENTIFAAKTALQNGANVLQVDVCWTKDRKIVVLHDETKENNLAKVSLLGHAQKKEALKSSQRRRPRRRENNIIDDM